MTELAKLYNLAKKFYLGNKKYPPFIIELIDAKLKENLREKIKNIEGI